LDALGAWENESTSFEISDYPHQGDGVGPDLLTTITDGYGNTIKPSYVSLSYAAGSTYTPTDDASYPYESDAYLPYVVSQVTYSDPSNPPNGTYQQTHYYSGAWVNEQGRGFAGFETHSVYDSRNQLYERQSFDLTFPFTGMQIADAVTEGTASGQPVWSSSGTPTEVTLDTTAGSTRYFPYISASTGKWYEVGGTDNGQLVKSQTGSYSYDNYGNLTSSTETVTDPANGNYWTTATTNTTDVDTSTWCLDLFTQTQVSYTAQVGASVTRTRDYVNPDLTHCRYTEIETAPSTSYQVTETLGYDDFGNINTDTMTGSGMTARQSAANWGTTGQFPMSVTDASNATTTFNYNFNYGLVSSQTDPNGLTTSAQYGDGFGRPTQITHPDGTYTTLTYQLDTGGPLARLIVGAQPHDTANNVITTTQYYYDMLDRPLYRTDTLLSGTQVWAKTQNYDSLGRIESTCAPYALTGTSPGCTTYTYDVLNRLTETQRPISQTDSTLETTSYTYAGDVATITDPNGHTRTLTKNPMGWLSQTTDALGYSVNLGYDAAGSKTAVTDSLGNAL
jgi:YD repeat-containing protein